MVKRKTSMGAINRYKDDRGVWKYRDPQEANFFWWVWPEIPLESIDDFIDGLQCDKDGKPVHLRDEERAQLLEERGQALRAYIAGTLDLANALATVLHRSCEYAGLYIAAVPLARKGKASIDGGKAAAAARKTATAEQDRKIFAKFEAMKRDGDDAEKIYRYLQTHFYYASRRGVEKAIARHRKKNVNER